MKILPTFPQDVNRLFLAVLLVFSITFFSSCATRKIKEASEKYIGFEFKEIKAGFFLVGSPNIELSHTPDKNLHKIEISRDFEIQVTPVTQFQWYSIMGNNPARFKEQKYCKDTFVKISGELLCPDHPIERVSWEDAQSFVKRMNQIQKDYRYRLPTEAEWEFAVRSGTSTAYSFGDDPKDLPLYAWFDNETDDGSGMQSHPAKRKLPTSIGLYDVHGNIWEWVQDARVIQKMFLAGASILAPYASLRGRRFYGQKTFSWITPVLEGTFIFQNHFLEHYIAGKLHVIRGGSWSSSAPQCRSASRMTWVSTRKNSDIGFRLAREKI